MTPSKRYRDINHVGLIDTAPPRIGLGSKPRSTSLRELAAPPQAAPLSARGYGFKRFTPILTSLCAIVFVTASTTLLYPFIPAVQYRLGQQAAPASNPTAVASATAPAQSGKSRLIIPKIGVDTAILEGATLDVLDVEEGVWHQTGELNQGNFVVAGHRFRYLPPNTSTLYNLDKLQVGDTVVIDREGKRSVYLIKELKTVPETAVNILDNTPKNQVTIYTCSDMLESQRVVAIAEPLP